MSSKLFAEPRAYELISSEVAKKRAVARGGVRLVLWRWRMELVERFLSGIFARWVPLGDTSIDRGCCVLFVMDC